MARNRRPAGSVIEREKGERYLVRWFIGKDVTGKRIDASKTIRGDRAAAKLFLASQMAGVQDAELWKRLFAWIKKPGSAERLRQFLDHETGTTLDGRAIWPYSQATESVHEPPHTTR